MIFYTGSAASSECGAFGAAGHASATSHMRRK